MNKLQLSFMKVLHNTHVNITNEHMGLSPFYSRVGTYMVLREPINTLILFTRVFSINPQEDKQPTCSLLLFMVIILPIIGIFNHNHARRPNSVAVNDGIQTCCRELISHPKRHYCARSDSILIFPQLIKFVALIR